MHVDKLCAGIDLGTTNSCIAVLQDGKPVVIRNDLDLPTTPSLVSIQPDGVVVGKPARKFLLTHPVQTFASIKRKMGERYTRTVSGKEYTPESVSALILATIKRNAESRLGRVIEDVVITVPANFNSVQRQATKDAGEIAGFNVLRVINEPTAAALAYGHEHQLSSVMVVFDLGGGTFDISVVEASGGVYEVIHSHGDNQLGGDDFNMRIVGWIVQEFAKETGHDVRRDVAAMQLVQEWAIAAKHGLTSNDEVRIKIPDLRKGASFDRVLTLDAYERLCKDLLARVRGVAEHVAKELAKPRYRDAHPGVFDGGMSGCDILLVGGETRVRCVRKLVREIFKGRIHTDVNPDEVVALGAALQAGIIQRDGHVKDIVLVDTTALALGTETKGGLFSKLIEANTPIPVSKSAEFTPVADMQPSVVIKVFQGASELCENNVKLGEFEFALTPPRRREDATIGLTYHLDSNDILHVSAIDKKTNAKQEVTIKGSQNLDRDTVERLKKEAWAALKTDGAKARKIERNNQLESFVRDIVAQLPELTARDPSNKFLAKTSEYAERLVRALESHDESRITQASSDLDAIWEKLMASLPAEPSRRPQPQERPTPRPASPQKWAQGTSDTVSCGNCGARLIPDMAFCGKCGVPLKKDSCGKCGAALVEGFEFCGKCGTPV